MNMDILSYGAIGLGLALATLAFRLINNEQKKEKPSSKIVFMTYAFIILAIILAGMGFTSENKELKNLQDENKKIKNQNFILQSSIESLKETNNKFEKVKHSIDLLLNIKGSLINKSDKISEIKSQLILIQETIQKELNIIQQNY